MTRDDITRMAKDAGISYSGTLPEIFDSQDQLERFAVLVATHERAECAKVCDSEADHMEVGAQRAIENGEPDEVASIRATAWKLSVVANRIRARSKQ